MLSARAIYAEILDDDETFRLFCSVAAKGEAQGGWENERIARLTRDACLARKIAHHGEDEDKHGRLFGALLRRRGLEPIPVPAAADYTVLLERAGIGLSHRRLQENRPLSDEELLRYLVHSRVTEQRAAEEVATQRTLFGDRPDLGKVIRVIAEDEANHLTYCHEELLRFAGEGHADLIRRMLREYALVEIRTYRDVSLEIMGRMAARLGWPAWKRTAIAAGIRAVYWLERLGGWRRMATLRKPERPHTLGTRARGAPSEGAARGTA